VSAPTHEAPRHQDTPTQDSQGVRPPIDTGPNQRGQGANPHGRSISACPETVLSIFTRILALVDIPSIILAIGWARWSFARSRLLDQAGPTALLHGDEEKRREAALKVIAQLTSDDGSWVRAILPWRSPTAPGRDRTGTTGGRTPPAPELGRASPPVAYPRTGGSAIQTPTPPADCPSKPR
jgi:hypothetical protein